MTVIFVGCKSGEKNDQNQSDDNNMKTSITETRWELSELDGKTIFNSDNPEENIHFMLDEGENKITGFAGCNRFFGTYTLEEGMQIKFSAIGTTRMACPGNEINEQELLQVFEKANNFTVDGNKLMLNVGKRAPLAVFTKKAVSEDPITEKYWKLKTLEGQAVEMDANQEREMYFMLKTNENQVRGFSGCNSFSGSYTLEEGNRIRFSQMASTMKACPDVDAPEVEFLKVFELADNYTINGDELSLNVGRRAPLAVFEAVYFD